jgi:predicted Zn-dependent protease
MTRPTLPLLALLAVFAAATGSGCASGKPRFEKDAQGRTILLSEADAVSIEESQRARRDVLLTEADDARVGREGAEGVAAGIGLLGDEALDAHLQRVGDELLRGVPRTFAFQFRVVDQVEPNAFALPGGYVYVSRGLLALASSEDELANVVGHEIAHVIGRHAAIQQAIERQRSPFVLPWYRAGEDAAYSRDMERQADREGQLLAAAAGYDPMALSRFLAALDRNERFSRGLLRTPSLFDTHPGTAERAGWSAVRAGEIRWDPDPERGDTHESYLRRIDGLPWGDRPEGGVFDGSRFLHPVLGFQLRFPDGWRTANSAGAVAAASPDRQALVFLEPSPPADDPMAAAERFLDELGRESRDVDVVALDRIHVAGAPGARLEVVVGGRVHALVAFFAFRGSHYRITGVTPAGSPGARGLLLATMRSFRPLEPAAARRIEARRIRLAEARSGEDLATLCRRVGCAAGTVGPAAILNGIDSAHRFGGGELVKVVRAEAWQR